MLVYGRNTVNEILDTNTKVNKVFLDNNFNDELLLSKINKKNLKKFHIDKNKLDRMCNNSANQGIALDIEEYKYYDFEELKKDNNSNFVVMLDSLEDPHNFGAIIRTCVAAGVDGIIIPKDRSVSVNSTVMKTSVGAALNIKIAMVTNLNQAIKYLKEKNYWIYSSGMEGETYTNMNYDGSIALVIGNEGKGVSDLVEKSSDYVISIPMTEKVESLNASVAAGILIYEAKRKRSK